MSRIAYVNGRYQPHRAASVHIEDRGYQFSDGIYEVVPVIAGRLVDEGPHLDRMERSLNEMRLPMPMSRRALSLVMREVLRRNGIDSMGLIYLQITRGVARRDHAFPAADTPPAVVMTAKRITRRSAEAVEQGVSVITVPDIRWGRPDIKTVSLLPNCLAKQQAKEAGCYEAFQVGPDGFVTEGTSSNAWIVTTDGELVTRDAGRAILNGITRLSVLKVAGREGVRFVERPFTPDEAKRAKEAFVTSSTSFVLPVTRIDDQVIGNGRAGSVTLALARAYDDYVQSEEATAAA